MLFLGAAASVQGMPLAETTYLVPVSEIELFLREEVHVLKRTYRRDTAGIGFGVTSWMSAWVRFDYCTMGLYPIRRTDIGDLSLKAKFVIGDWFDQRLHLGFLVDIRFPTGRNAYASADWRTLALGKTELKLGPFWRIDIARILYLHFNCFYVFREGTGEDFWGGFFIDITKQETWENVFGFNPAKKNTFFSTRRLKNDYVAGALAISTDLFYPLTIQIECYGSVRVSRAPIDTGNVPIEGCGINPLLLSAGVRYFITPRLYVGLYTVQNPIKQEDYIRAIYGLECSIQL